MSLDPETVLQVLPRHLAGPGSDRLLDVWPFPFEQGWSLHRPEEGYQLAASPCQLVRAGFVAVPGSRYGGTWTTAVHEDPLRPARWQAVFDASTPAEVQRAFYTELLSVYFEAPEGDRRRYTSAAEPHEVYPPLLNAGWRQKINRNGRQAIRSPDGLAYLHNWYHSPPEWTVCAGHPNRPLWTATFSAETPSRLVAAFNAALVDPDPLTRTVRQLPAATREHLHRHRPPAPTRSR
ncbi:DUF317 domain-containing protein [Streptomyces bathyalis]|uniref:DUF317 domain-containing protein n=1 Tax=Streptomyces bathyalis TaxID=2710756 RepID=A0A7T1T2F2_9ACTN|nr:DUF317 domain-containing protein [Streptomyces bathyalis]QPP05159.1 DUF317 domain-containing protein [Streptomyces bathyalis]